MGGEILLLDSVSVLRFIEYRYHGCGGFLQNISSDFVETDEIDACCAGFLHLGKSWVEMGMKWWYNGVWVRLFKASNYIIKAEKAWKRLI